MSEQEWKEFIRKDKAIIKRYSYYKALADKQSEHLHKKAKKLSVQAGLDPTLLGIHPHNAMVSKHYGKPWVGVNYQIVEKIQEIVTNQQFIGSRVARAWCSEKSAEIRGWGNDRI